jgi:hypothetical protein
MQLARFGGPVCLALPWGCLFANAPVRGPFNKKCAGCIQAAGARKHAGSQTRINLIPEE